MKTSIACAAAMLLFGSLSLPAHAQGTAKLPAGKGAPVAAPAPPGPSTPGTHAGARTPGVHSGTAAKPAKHHRRLFRRKHIHRRHVFD